MPGITSLRGLAALWVVVYHLVDYLPHSVPDSLLSVFAYGYLGVDLFFVMSGFIISYVHWRDFSGLSRRTTLNFMVKRVGRIYPLHLFMLLLYLSVPIVRVTLSSEGVLPERYSVWSFALNLLLIHSAGFISYASWNFPSWSISVEFFAYLVFPLIAWMGHRSTSYSVDRFVFVLCFCLLAFIFWSSGRSNLDVMFGLSVVRGVVEFAAGCFLLKMFVADSWRALRDSLLVALSFGFLALTIAPFDYVVWPAVCALVIVLAASAQSMRLSILCAPLLVFLGEISYSVYMSHAYVREIFKFIFVEEGQGMSWIVVVAYFLVVLVMSSLLYYMVERPARAWSRRVGKNLVGDD